MLTIVSTSSCYKHKDELGSKQQHINKWLVGGVKPESQTLLSITNEILAPIPQERFGTNFFQLYKMFSGLPRRESSPPLEILKIIYIYEHIVYIYVQILKNFLATLLIMFPTYTLCIAQRPRRLIF